MAQCTITMSMLRAVKIDNCKGEWIIRDGDIKHVDDIVFVKLCTQNSSLSTLLGNTGGFRCLTRSIGYNKIRELRNDQATLADAPECNLFGDDDDDDDDALKKKTKNKKRSSPKRLCAELDTRDIMTIDLKHGDVTHKVKLLRPKSIDDCVFIAFEKDTIQPIMKYIKEKGFAAEVRMRHKKPDSIPEGIWRHSKGFLVNYTNAHGVKRLKLKPTLAEAMHFQAEPLLAEQVDEQHDEHHVELSEESLV